MAKIKITETVLSSAPSALLSTPMPLSDIQDYLTAIDQAQYYSCDIMNRDIFYNSMTKLGEDPWQRIQAIAKGLPNTRLQVTFAGSYLWGSRIFENSVIDFFVNRLKENNISIVRIFDPLNDINNLKHAIKAARAQNMHIQAGMVYTTSEDHTNTTFLTYAKKLQDLGVDSICVLDPGELLGPYSTYKLIADLKNEITIPIQFSTPNSTGVGYMNSLKAIEAGADIIDAAISPFAEGASYPATETLVDVFKNTPYDSDMDLNKLEKVEEAFSRLKEKYLASGNLCADKMAINPIAGRTKLPDNVIDYIMSIVKSRESEMLDKVLDETFRLRELSGNPPFSYPVYVGLVDQAVINTTTGKEFAQISPEFLMLIKGAYGDTPAAISPSFKDNLIAQSQTSKASLQDVLATLEEYQIRLPQKFNEQPEDVLTLAQFPAEAPTYFESRSDRLYGIDGKNADRVNQIHPI